VLAPGAARGTTLVDWDASADGNVAIVERVDMEVVRSLLLASTREKSALHQTASLGACVTFPEARSPALPACLRAARER
jgi:hypothetical protein